MARRRCRQSSARLRRVEAAKRAGKTSIATLRVEHLSEAQLWLYAIADNKIAERSTWDENALALEFRDLRIIGSWFATIPSLEISMLDRRADLGRL